MKRSSGRNPGGGPPVFRCAMPRPRNLALAVATLALLAAREPLRAGDETQPPLPDLNTFLGEVRDRLHTDDYLLDQYTFLEKQTEKQLDSDGHVKSVTSSVYEVYPSPEPGKTYRKLVERDGKKL